MLTSMDAGDWIAWIVAGVAALVWGALFAWSIFNLKRCEALLAGAKELSVGLRKGIRLTSCSFLGPELQELLDEVQKSPDRQRQSALGRAARNLAVIEVDWRLEQCRSTTYAAWRTAAAVGAGAVFTLVLTAPGLAALSALTGFAVTLGIFSIGRMADLTRRRAREEWNALIRALEGTFTTG
jgi:hypothetical protein